MKRAVGFFLLCLLGFSLFVLVVAPIEIYQTLSARTWEPVEVRITSSRLREIAGRFSLELRVQELASNKRSRVASVRYGDLPLSFIVFGGLFASSLYADRDRYPPGATVTAYRSPDGLSYVLEQNSVDLMVWVFVLACIYPGIAAWALITRRHRSRGSARRPSQDVMK